ncbi:hypothetical protein ACP70R_018816 [Stipagrostis hirtigluma subsp. patula]
MNTIAHFVSPGFKQHQLLFTSPLSSSPSISAPAELGGGRGLPL